MRIRLLLRLLVLPALIVAGALAAQTASNGASVAEAQIQCVPIPGFWECPPTSIPVTNTRTATPTVPTATATRTNTPVPPTNTPVPPTATNTATATNTPLPADLVLVKTAPTAVNQGATLTYTLTVSNTGGSQSLASTITDTLPAGTSFTSAGAGCVHATGVVTCLLQALNPGASQTYTFAVTVTGAVSPLVNTALVVPVNGETNVLNNTSTASTNITGVFTATPTVTNTPTLTPTATPFVDVSLVKTANTNVVAPGGTIIFTLTVKNNGTAQADNIVITDTLPTGVTPTLVSPGNPACAITAQVVTCTYLNLPAGQQLIVTITATVTATSSFSNTASVTTSSTDAVANNNSSTLPITVATSDVSITKTGPTAPLVVNNPVTFTLVAANAANASTAAGVTVIDHLPPNFTVLSTSPALSTTSPLPVGACATSVVIGAASDPQGAFTHTDVTCNVGTLAGGANSTITIVAIATGSSGSFTNFSTISTTTAGDPTGNNSSSISVTVEGPDLTITKTASATTTTAGNLITYSLTVSNIGSLDTRVDTIIPLVRDLIPNGMQFVGFGGTNWNCQNNNNQGQQTVDCSHPGYTVLGQPGQLKGIGAPTSLQTLPVLTIIVNTAIDCPKTYTNTATVDPLGLRAEQNENNNTATAPVVTANCATTNTAALTISKTASASTIFVPSVLTYTVTVTSTGGIAATNVVLTDVIPEGFQGVHVLSGTGCSVSAGQTRTLTCNFGTMNPAAQQVVVFEVEVEGTFCRFTNTAGAVGGNAAAVSSSVTTSVSPCPDLRVTKTNSATGPVVLGGVVTFNITVTNLGEKPAGTLQPPRPIVLVDTMDKDLELLQILPGTSGFHRVGNPNLPCESALVGNPQAVVITCERSTPLSQNESAVLQIVAQLSKDTTVTDCTFSNSVVVDPVTNQLPFGLIQETNESNNSGSSSVQGLCADVAVTKSINANPVSPGSHPTYTITVTNTGAIPATGITLTDLFDIDFNAETATIVAPGSGACTITPGTVNTAATMACTLGGLQPGGQIVITVAGTVRLTPANCTLVNTAVVAIVSPEISTSNNTATNTANINCLDLSVTKSGADDPQPNQDVKYTIVVSNNGTLVANPVRVVDHLDDNPQMVFLSATTTQGSCTNAAGVGAHVASATAPILPARAGSHADVTCDLGALIGAAAGVDNNGNPTLIPSTATIVITVKVPANAVCGTPIGNFVVVDPLNVISEFNETNNTAVIDPGPIVDCPSLTVTKSASPAAPVPSGSLLTYTVTVTNTGTASFGPIQMVDHLDNAITTFISAAGPAGSSCSTANVAPHSNPLTVANHIDVTCTSPAALLPGANIQFTIVVITPPANGVLQNIACAIGNANLNTASVCSDVLSTQIGSGTIGVDFAVLVCENPDAGVAVGAVNCAQTSPTTVAAGDPLNFVIRAANLGNVTPLNDATVVITMPQNLSNASVANDATGDDGASLGCAIVPASGPGQVITCSSVNLPAGDVDDIIVNAIVTPQQPLADVSANVAAACGSVTAVIDPADGTFELLENNNSSSSVGICPNLKVTKTANPARVNNAVPFDPTLTYTITIQNNGNAPTTANFGAFPAATPAPSPILVDTLPPGVAVNSVVTDDASLSCQTSAPPGGQSVVISCFDTNGLAAGGQHTVTIQVTIPQANLVPSICGTIVNRAVVDPNNIQPENLETVADNEATASTFIDCGDLDIFQVENPFDENVINPASFPANVSFPNFPFNTIPGISPEDLNAPNSFTALKQYVLVNDGVEAITGISFTGTITPNNVTVTPGASRIAVQGGANSWSCSITTTAWTCAGNLAADNNGPAGFGDNQADGPDSDEVRVTVMIVGTVDNNSLNWTVALDPAAPTCTSFACTSGAASRSNADGSVLDLVSKNEAILGPNLSVTKTPATQTVNNASGTAQVTWLVTVTNIGTGPTTATWTTAAPIVRDTLPAGLTFAGTPAATNGYSCVNASTTVTNCSGPTLAAAASFVVTVIADIAEPTGCGTKINTADADPTDAEQGPNEKTSDNQATATATINCADLDGGDDNSPTAVPGVTEDFNVNGVDGYKSTKQYSLWNDGSQALVVTFTGTIAAPGTVVTGLIDPVGGNGWNCNLTPAFPAIPTGWSCTGTLDVSPTPNDNAPTAYPGDGSSVFINIRLTGTGAAGGSTVTYTAIAPVCNLTCTSGSATAGNADGLTFTQAGDLLTPNVDTLYSVDLVVSKSDAPDPFNAGDPGALLTYSVTVTNNGTGTTDANFSGVGAPPTGPLVVDHLPSGLIPTNMPFINGTLTCTSAFIPGGDAQQVGVPHWDVICHDTGSLAAAASATATIIVAIDVPSLAACGVTVTNKAVADPNLVQDETDDTNNGGQTTTTINCADLDKVGASVDSATQFAGDDLDVAGGWRSTAEYSWRNDGIQPLTFTFTVTANVTTPGAIYTSDAFNSTNVNIVCTVPTSSTTTKTFSCTGILAADDGVLGGPDEVTVSFAGIGAAGPGQIGSVITWTPGLPTCSAPGACTTLVPDPANSDASDLTFATDTDTLVGWDLVVSKTGLAVVNNVSPNDVAVTYQVTVTNQGNAATPAGAFASALGAHTFIDHLPANTVNPSNLGTFATASGTGGTDPGNVLCHIVNAAAATPSDPQASQHTEVQCHDENGMLAGESNVITIVAWFSTATCGDVTNELLANSSVGQAAPGPALVVVAGEAAGTNNSFSLPQRSDCGDIDLVVTESPGAEDLSIAGGFSAMRQLHFANDGFTNITSVTVTGTVSGSGNAIITSLTTATTGGQNLSGGCNLPASPFTFSCTFDVIADEEPAGQGLDDDFPGNNSGDDITITLTAAGTSPTAQQNDRVLWSVTTITGSGITSGTASPNNADGSVLVAPSAFDLLVP